jgi:hypothetical protein
MSPIPRPSFLGGDFYGERSMTMYFPEWSKHEIEEETDATLAMCGEDLATKVYFGFHANVECEWSLYDFNPADPDDYPEPPSFRDYTIEDLTICINGEEAFPGDTLYSLAYDWACEQIKYYDYEDGLEFVERDNPWDEYDGDDYTECD